MIGDITYIHERKEVEIVIKHGDMPKCTDKNCSCHDSDYSWITMSFCMWDIVKKTAIKEFLKEKTKKELIKIGIITEEDANFLEAIHYNRDSLDVVIKDAVCYFRVKLWIEELEGDKQTPCRECGKLTTGTICLDCIDNHEIYYVDKNELEESEKK